MRLRLSESDTILRRAAIAALCAAMISTSCSDDSPTRSDGPPDTTYTTLNWVGTEVLYRPVEGKHDLSLLFVLHSDCGWCAKLKRETLTDSTVIQILGESFNIAQLDMKVDTAVVYFDSTVSCQYLAHTVYDVGGWPTMIALDREGAEIGRILGYKDPEPFAMNLEAIRGD